MDDGRFRDFSHETYRYRLPTPGGLATASVAGALSDLTGEDRERTVIPTMSIDKLDIREIAVNVPATLASLESITPVTAAHYRRNHFPTPVVDSERWAIAIGGAVAEPLVIGAAALSSAERARCRSCSSARDTAAPSTALPLLGSLGRRRRLPGGVVGVPLVMCSIGRGFAATRWRSCCAGPTAAPRSIPASTPTPARCRPQSPPSRHAARMRDERPADSRRAGGPVRVIVPGWYGMDSVKWLAGCTWSLARSTDRFRRSTTAGVSRATAPGPGAVSPRWPCIRSSPGRATTSPLRPAPSTCAESPGQPASPSPRSPSAATSTSGSRRPSFAAPGRYGMTHWHATVTLDPGPHRLSVRATDNRGATQPATAVPNLGGYCTNAVHRISVTAETR